MPVRVDAASGVVVDGDDTWPLRLDLRTGEAIVSLSGGEIVVHPLRWRHKQRLARWAHLGPAFVADQAAALAVEPGTELDERGRALVLAVAAFLDGDGLPLEPGLLASVAAEACLATGLAPAALDDREASEVELLWQTSRPGPSAAGVALPLGGVGRAAPDPWADATRIVFDGPADAQDPAAAASPGAGADGAPDEDVTPPSTMALGSMVTDDTEPPRPSRRRDRPAFRIVPAPPRPATTLPITGGTASRPEEAASRTGDDRSALATLVAEPGEAVGLAGPGLAPTGTTHPRLLRAPALSPSPARAEPAAALHVPSPRRDRPDRRTDLVPVPAAHAALAAPVGRPPQAERAAEADDLDALTEAVAERLAELVAAAADDLGIEV
jgi:hypothetical protein